MATRLRILICGGGCAGPSLGFWLARAGHDVTIVERHPVLRAAGAQIDLRAQGIQVVKKMGIMEAIRAKLVDEEGKAYVDKNGKVRAVIRANKSGKGAQSLTSEYEIMRGDLVRILYDATKDQVEYIFGKTVDSFKQDDDSVTVYFSDGKTDVYDILIGADGQGSRIRKAILPPDGPEPYRHLGLYTAYWIIPRDDETDTNMCMHYTCRRKWIFRRSHSPTETQAYFFLREDSEELRKITRAPIEEQKKFWTARYKGSGWETERFIRGMETTQNFYCQEIVQVQTDTWHKGRVVLLADAAHCPSPMSGMGTTSAFVGAYVLAGEICKNPTDLEAAFKNYDAKLRPFVNEIQKINPFLFKIAFPSTEFGVRILYLLMMVVCFLRIPDLVSRFSKEDKGGWVLPEYSELGVSVEQKNEK